MVLTCTGTLTGAAASCNNQATDGGWQVLYCTVVKVRTFELHTCAASWPLVVKLYERSQGDMYWAVEGG